MKTIGIIGGGNMGAAILSGVYKSYKASVCEKDKKRGRLLKRRFGVAHLNLDLCVRQSEIVILAVKPQDAEGVLAAVQKLWGRDKLMISIAAGLTTAYLEKKLGDRARVVRVMPNMPAMIGEGISAVAKGKFAKTADVRLTREIFSCVGKTMIIDEKKMDAVTAVSGSGPAYVFLFVECLMKAARSLGLPDYMAKELIESTLVGSAHLLVKQKDEAATLRARVTSKGGTTQAAVDVFMKNRIERIYQDALKAAAHRARELAR